MAKECTPDNASAYVFGHLLHDGVELDVAGIYELPAKNISSVYEPRSLAAEEAFNTAPPSERHAQDNAVIEAFLGSGDSNAGRMLKNIVLANRNPSTVLGDEFTKPVIDFLESHYLKHAGDLEAGKKEYFKGIKSIFQSMDETQVPQSQQWYFRQYRDFYANKGGELYNLEKSGPLVQPVSNVISNTIKSSPNVLMGNVLEATIKMPTLYGLKTLPALMKTIKENPWRQFDARGAIYGIDYAGDANKGLWKGIIGISDTPLKNLAYNVGEISGRGGSRAVQDVAFLPRLGDMPMRSWSPASRSATQLLGYTIETYKMYTQLWKKALTDPVNGVMPLVTYHTMAGIIGGPAAAFPGVAQWLIENNTDWGADWFEENKGPLTQLVQPGTFGRFGIGYDIANRTLGRVGKQLEGGSDAFAEGDGLRGVLDMTDAAITLTMFSNATIGDAQAQKLMRIAKDVVLEDLATEDIPQELLDTYVPSLNIELDEAS